MTIVLSMIIRASRLEGTWCLKIHAIVPGSGQPTVVSQRQGLNASVGSHPPGSGQSTQPSTRSEGHSAGSPIACMLVQLLDARTPATPAAFFASAPFTKDLKYAGTPESVIDDTELYTSMIVDSGTGATHDPVLHSLHPSRPSVSCHWGRRCCQWPCGGRRPHPSAALGLPERP